MHVILCNYFRDGNMRVFIYTSSSTLYCQKSTTDLIMTTYKSHAQTQMFHLSNIMYWRSFSCIGTKFRFGDFIEEV